MSMLHISRAGTSGLSVYRILRRAGDNYRWIVGNGFEAYNAANLTSYAIVLTDDGGDVYSADVDFTAAAGRYIGKDYIRAGATPAADDYPLPGEEVYNWNGVALDLAAHYSSQSLMALELLGTTNYELQADGENNGLATDIANSGEYALDKGDAGVNDEFSKASPPPAAYPVVSMFPWFEAAKQIAATEISTGELLNLRYQRDHPQGTDRPGDMRIASGRARIAALVVANLPGVTVTTTTADSDLNPLSAVSVAATKDACGCPLPAATCGYGYRSRFYVYP